GPGGRAAAGRGRRSPRDRAGGPERPAAPAPGGAAGPPELAGAPVAEPAWVERERAPAGGPGPGRPEPAAAPRPPGSRSPARHRPRRRGGPWRLPGRSRRTRPGRSGAPWSSGSFEEDGGPRLDEARDRHGVPVGETHAAVREGLADPLRFRRAVDPVVFLI